MNVKSVSVITGLIKKKSHLSAFRLKKKPDMLANNEIILKLQCPSVFFSVLILHAIMRRRVP